VPRRLPTPPGLAHLRTLRECPTVKPCQCPPTNSIVRQLQFDSDRQSDTRIRAVVKVVSVVIGDVKVIGIEPVSCPGFRVGIHEQERIAAVLETRIPHVNAG